jgi:hypothetical protein
VEFKLRRWALRRGLVVEWGNVVGPYRGQEFRETFRNEAEARERERQANACESIGDERPPVAVKREQLH